MIKRDIENYYTKKYKGFLIIINEEGSSMFKCDIYSKKPGKYFKRLYCDDFEECIKIAKEYIDEEKCKLCKWIKDVLKNS